MQMEHHEHSPSANVVETTLAKDGEEPNFQEKASTSRPLNKTNRKVVVQNVLKFLKTKQLEKMAEEWVQLAKEEGLDVSFERVKKPPKDNFIALTLDSQENVEPFVRIFNEKKPLNKKGGLMVAKAFEDDGDRRLSNKRSREEDESSNNSSPAKKAAREEQRPPRDVRDVVTPLWKETYEAQLNQKTRLMIKKCCVKIVNEVRSKFQTLRREAKFNPHRKVVTEYAWLKPKTPIMMQDILPACAVLRNKCEFNFGYRQEHVKLDDGRTEEKRIPSVGFFANGWSGGVSRPHACQNIPSEACAIADIIESFLETSPMPPYDSFAHRGFWRYVTVRLCARTGQIMLIFVHAPPTGGAGKKDSSDDYTATFETEKERLITLLTEGELKPAARPEFPSSNVPVVAPQQEKPMKVTSIYFQEYEGLSHPSTDCPVQHVWGSEGILEKLGDCTFRISPGAFFQVITPCAENLYGLVADKVRDVSSGDKPTLLLDVCCGTGTIGLTCLKMEVASRVVGVDISQPAIDDAKYNAELNGFNVGSDSTSTRFVASRAELVLFDELKKIDSSKSNIVAVVDPAREGLHPDVIRSLRLCQAIERIVYVSCNPTGSLVRDASMLCAPPTKKYGGKPFKPTFSKPVDMFPLTDHCEMVMTFDRLSDEEVNGSD